MYLFWNNMVKTKKIDIIANKIYNIFLFFAKPNGIGPINPPNAKLTFDEPEKLEIIITNTPTNINKVPIKTKSIHFIVFNLFN